MAMPNTPERPLPQATAETAAYWQGARGGRLLVQRCRVCGRHQFYPRAFCTHCLSDAVEWVPACGLGRIYSFAICRMAPSAAFDGKLPYAVAMIDLDEGVRMLANIIDTDITRIAVGARVSVRFEQVGDGIVLPQFSLAD
jgi:uncharacterized OB-fold protein